MAPVTGMLRKLSSVGVGRESPGSGVESIGVASTSASVRGEGVDSAKVVRICSALVAGGVSAVAVGSGRDGRLSQAVKTRLTASAAHNESIKGRITGAILALAFQRTCPLPCDWLTL